MCISTQYLADQCSTCNTDVLFLSTIVKKIKLAIVQENVDRKIKVLQQPLYKCTTLFKIRACFFFLSLMFNLLMYLMKLILLNINKSVFDIVWMLCYVLLHLIFFLLFFFLIFSITNIVCVCIESVQFFQFIFFFFFLTY